MRSRVVPTIALLGASILAGCGRGAESPDTKAETFVLYSIDGRFGTKDKVPEAGELFHGFPVLGKLDIKDAKTRSELVTAFKEGISRSDGEVAKCFWPRHAIRTVHGSETTDYVICFECLQYVIFHGEKSSPENPIDGSPLEKFNEILKRANVPLAPSAFEPEQ